MSVSGVALGTLIATKVTPPTVDAATRLQMLDTWVKVGEAICEFLAMQQVVTSPTTLSAPGPVTLANGGGPALGAIILPPIPGNIILP